MPVPASISAIFGAPARSRAAKANVASSVYADCSARASRPPTSCRSRLRASMAATGCAPGLPGGASSSHLGSPRHTSKPASGGKARCVSPIASSTAGAQRHPAFSIEAASGRSRSRSASVSARSSSSNEPAAVCSALADSSGVCGMGSISARASPSGDGMQGCAGRTKANSSSTSNRGRAGATFSRPATKMACVTSTSPARNSRRASSRPKRRVSPGANATAAPPAAGTSAGTPMFDICAHHAAGSRACKTTHLCRVY